MFGQSDGKLETHAKLSTMKLDRTSFEPLYHQLHQLLKQRIETAEWPPGALVPSEPELCRHFGVSRMVVRQALAMLEDDHRVTRSRGRGTFVSEQPASHRAGGLIRILQEPRAAGVVIDVLDRAPVNGRSPVSGQPDLPKAESLVCVTTLLTLNGRATAVSNSYFSDGSEWLERVPATGRIEDEFILKLGHLSLMQPQISVEIGRCSELASHRLGVPIASPVFVSRVTEFEHLPTGAGGSLEFSYSEYRTDSLDCRLTVTRGSTPAMVATFVRGGMDGQ